MPPAGCKPPARERPFIPTIEIWAARRYFGNMRFLTVPSSQWHSPRTSTVSVIPLQIT
jgi:hypothetical protein